MAKYFYAILGGGILLWGFVILFPTIQSAQNSATTEIAGSVGNYDGLANVMEASPLLLLGAIFAVPIVIIAVYLWQRQQRAGG